MEKHNTMTVFNKGEFGEVRTVLRDGQPWFVAADVCKALGHSNPTMALEALDNDEKAKFSLGLPGGDTNVVNEPGLYSLILSSRKSEAKAFKRWVTHEVLPEIRKKGFYSMLSEDVMAQVILERKRTNTSYFDRGLREIDWRLISERWIATRELWEVRKEYDFLELDDRLAEIWAGDYEFYHKASAHFWKHNYYVMSGKREDKWKAPTDKQCRRNPEGKAGENAMEKACQEADDYWTMCQWYGDAAKFGDAKATLKRMRWGRLPVENEFSERYPSFEGSIELRLNAQMIALPGSPRPAIT